MAQETSAKTQEMSAKAREASAGTPPVSETNKSGANRPRSSVEPNTLWHKPKPSRLPRPAYWPAVLAFGIVFTLWGLVASPILSIAGLVCGAIGIIGWIQELLREAPDEDHDDPRA